MADDELEDLRRLAALAGFVPFATAQTPWPATRERAVESLNRRVRLCGERLRATAAVADPTGFLGSHQGGLDECVAAVSAWTLAWERAGLALADADDVSQQGVERDVTEAALTALDRATSDVRACGKVYLAAWGDFRSEPYPYAVAPLTNVALYAHRWCRDIVRRRPGEESLTQTLASASHLHWGVQNIAGTVEDKTLPGVTEWFREVAAFVDALLAVIVEVTVAAGTVVRYHQ